MLTVVAAATAIWISCASDRPGNVTPDSRPNIVVLVMDTVRRDHMPFHGYRRETAPNLSRMLAESRIYEEAYSVSSWTAPAHASLFTGLYPIAHGTTQQDWRLDDRLVTLAEVLDRLGYRTIGITENPVVSRLNHFDQGFSEFHETWKMKRRPGQHDGYLAVMQLRQSLARLDRRRPFFFFINLAEPHNPYDSSMQFRGEFVSDPSIDLSGQRLPGFYLGETTYSKDELRHLAELYDAEIRMVDHLIGRIIEELERHGSWDETIFIVTSDHGENLGDHGHVDHVFSVYETTLKVPLIVHYPPRFSPGSVDSDPAQLTDIFPTLVKLLGVEELLTVSQGADLLEPGAREDRTVFCEYYRPKQVLKLFNENDRNSPALRKFDRHLQVAIHDKRKLIQASDGRSELYDLATDPGETQNLITSAEHSGVRLELERTLEELARRFHRERGEPLLPDEQDIDEATREALRSLGYIQ